MIPASELHARANFKPFSQVIHNRDRTMRDKIEAGTAADRKTCEYILRIPTYNSSLDNVTDVAVLPHHAAPLVYS